MVYRIESILRPAACSAQPWDSGQSANMHQHLRCSVYHLPPQSARPWCDHPTNKTAHSTPHSTCSMSATCIALRRSPASAHTRSCGASRGGPVSDGWLACKMCAGCLARCLPGTSACSRETKRASSMNEGCNCCSALPSSHQHVVCACIRILPRQQLHKAQRLGHSLDRGGRAQEAVMLQPATGRGAHRMERKG